MHVSLTMRRPHRPRDPEVRGIYRLAGINLPGYVACMCFGRACEALIYTWHFAWSMHAGKVGDSGSSDSEASSSSTENDSDSECEDDNLEDESVMPLCLYISPHTHAVTCRPHRIHTQRCLLKSLLEKFNLALVFCQQMKHHSLWSQQQAQLRLQAANHENLTHASIHVHKMNAGVNFRTPPPVTASILTHSHACMHVFYIVLPASILHILRNPANRFAKHRKDCQIFAV